MDKKIAIEVAARIWCDPEMSSIPMDVALAYEIAELLASRLTTASTRPPAAPQEYDTAHPDPMFTPRESRTDGGG